MADLNFKIEGNSESFIKETERIRSSIRAVATETKIQEQRIDESFKKMTGSSTSASKGIIAGLGFSLTGVFRGIKAVAGKTLPVLGAISTLSDIYSLFTSRIKAQQEEQNKLNESMKAFNIAIQFHAARPIATIEQLSTKFQLLGDNMEAQKQFIVDNKKAFDELGVSVRSEYDAQQLLIDNKDTFIAAQIAKATSLTYQDKMKEVAARLVDAQMAVDRKEKDDAMGTVYKAPIGGEGNDIMKANESLKGFRDALHAFSMKEVEAAKTEMKYLMQFVLQNEKKAANLMKVLGVTPEAPQPRTGNTWQPSAEYLKQMELLAQREAEFAKREKSLEAKQINEKAVYYQNLLTQYQSYMEKRQAVETQFASERATLEAGGASEATLSEHDYQRNEALNAVDSQFAMRNDSYKGWIDEIANYTLEQLQKAYYEAEQALARTEFLQPQSAQLAVQRAKVAALSEATGKTTTKAAGKEVQTAPDKRSVKEWENLSKAIGGAESVLGEVGNLADKDTKKYITAATGISSAARTMIGGIVSLVNGSATAMEGTTQAAATSMKTVEKASVILAIIGAALQIATKIAGMFGADYDDYNAAKANYGEYVKVLDVVIGKQKELIETLTGQAVVEASEGVKELIKNQEQAARTIGRERLNAGASAGSHSIGVRIKKGMGDEGWGQWNNFAAANNINSDLGGRMTGLFDLSIEQLEKLQMEAPLFWAKLDGDVRGYLETIIECGVKTEEVIALQREQLTQVSFKDLTSEFADILADMDASSADFAENFEEYLRKAIIHAMMVKTYNGKIEEWHKAFENAASDDKIDEGEYAKLREDWNNLVTDALAERDIKAEIMGWESETESESSTNGGFQTMSQDTGSELNGRFTALQISNEEIKNSMLYALASMSVLCTSASDRNGILSEMRDLAFASNGHLENIASYTKVLLDVRSELVNINRNTKNM